MDPGTLVIPDFARIANEAADRKSTGAGPKPDRCELFIAGESSPAALRPLPAPTQITNNEVTMHKPAEEMGDNLFTTRIIWYLKHRSHTMLAVEEAVKIPAGNPGLIQHSGPNPTEVAPRLSTVYLLVLSNGPASGQLQKLLPYELSSPAWTGFSYTMFHCGAYSSTQKRKAA